MKEKNKAFQMGWIVLVVIVVIGIVLIFSGRPVASDTYSEQINPEQEPEQQTIETPQPRHFAKGGYDWTFTPRATYVLCGVVLSRKNYSSPWNGILSPCDVAIAWGDLVKNDLYQRVTWSQKSRWYWWQYGADFPNDNKFIVRNSANSHIIPASDNLARAAKSLSYGQVVELSGELVSITGKKSGFNCWWNSSLSRTDEGDGSCEVIYLKRLKVDGKIYE